MAVAALASLSFVPAQWLLKSDSLQAMFQFGWGLPPGPMSHVDSGLGKMVGSGIGVRNLLQGVDLRDGELALSLRGWLEVRIPRDLSWYLAAPGEIALGASFSDFTTPTVRFSPAIDSVGAMPLGQRSVHEPCVWQLWQPASPATARSRSTRSRAHRADAREAPPRGRRPAASRSWR